MRKRISLIVGLTALVLSPVAGLLGPGDGVQAWRVDRTYPEASFTPPYNVSNSPPPDYPNTQRVRAAIDSQAYLHVAWMEGRDGSGDGPAYVKGRDYEWPVWEPAGPFNNRGYTNPTVALDSSGTVHLAWGASDNGTAPYDVYYAFKPVGGGWSTPANISNSSYNTVFGQIAIDSQDRIWVAWQTSESGTDTEIYARSRPAGGSWGAIKPVSNNHDRDDQSPSIAIDNDDVPYVTWRSRYSGQRFDIFLSKYVDGAWTAPYPISATALDSNFPRVGTDDAGNAYVVWDEELYCEDCFQILCRRWDGTQWLGTTQISPPTLKALRPVIAVDHGNLYVVWQDYRDSAQGKPEIYFSHSTDYGATWSVNENASSNSTASYWPDVVAQAGGYAHIFWQDNATSENLDIYYSQATVDIGPTEPPTGWVDVRAHEPANDPNYTRRLDVTLIISATAAPGATVTHMRICNEGACDPLPAWEPFATSKPDWQLLDNGQNCGYRSVLIWFKDNNDLVSDAYSDYTIYDNNVVANMILNEGHPYTNRTMVMVNSQDEPAECTGLRQIRLQETGHNYTNWMVFYSRVYFFLAPSGSTERTVNAEYRDYVDDNASTANDSIVLDTIPPTGTAPVLNSGISWTMELEIPVSDLQGYDDQSGLANVWFANRPSGPWLAMPYVPPPHQYTWNLGYGGPPTQTPDLHRVYVKYEDDTGYESFPGNCSQPYSATISVGGIAVGYLPLVAKGHGQLNTAPTVVESEQVSLVLLTDPPQAGPGQDVLLYLAAWREQDEPLEGTLRLALPEGLRAVQAWSAYGQLLEVDDHLVISHERAWREQAAWIVVQARVVAGDALQVHGDMTWDQGSVTAPPVWIENR